jgi:putative nucleotidyltransferase with HDIG domain
MPRLDAEQLLRASESLPPFPDVIWKVIPLTTRMAPVSEIEAVIRYDQAITARVLALSQSTYYGRRHAVGSLKDAIVHLGQEQLLKVILAASANRYFNSGAAGYDLREGELWEHAVASALMTEIAAKQLGLNNSLTVYTAALLHDIGKTVLNFYVEAYFASILSLVQEEGMRFIDAERQVLGMDHQQLGMMITRRWRFPEEVVTAIGYHHAPLQAGQHNGLVRLIYVANRMVSALGIGCGVDGFMQPSQDEVFTELGISALMADKLLAELVVALQEVRQFLSS